MSEVTSEAAILSAMHRIADLMHSIAAEDIYRTLNINLDRKSPVTPSLCCYLFEGLQHFSSLTEVFEEELQRARHQGGVFLHDEMDQNSQKCPATFIIQLHCT